MKPPCVTIDVDGEIKAFKIDDDAVLVLRKSNRFRLSLGRKSAVSTW